MIISAKAINRPRKRRECSMCYAAISPPHYRLYGAAESGDEPYVIHLCRDCTEQATTCGPESDRRKLKAALNKEINGSEKVVAMKTNEWWRWCPECRRININTYVEGTHCPECGFDIRKNKP